MNASLLLGLQLNQIALYWTYIFLLIVTCLLGAFANLVNLIVFVRLNAENPIYKYMIYSSFANLVFLPLSMFLLVFKYESSCLLKEEISLLYALYYVSIVFEVFNVIIEILITWQRLVMVVNRFSLSQVSFKVLIVVTFVISLLFCSPIFVSPTHTMSHSNATTEAYSVLILTKHSQLNVRLFSYLSMVKSFMLGGLICVINLATWIKFKEQLKQKNNLMNPFRRGIFLN